MPWLLPLLIGAAFVGVAWAVTSNRGVAPPPLPPGGPARNPLLPRNASANPPLQPVRQSIQPLRPAPAPGVIPSMQHATQDAERTHGTTTEEVLSPPAVTTTEPLTPDAGPQSTVPGLVTSDPERPRIPPPIARAVRRDRLIAQCANPEVVEEHAQGAVSALRSPSISATARAAFIERFQDAYGQGLTSDGRYGPNTRRALAQILGVNERTLPPLPR